MDGSKLLAARIAKMAIQRSIIFYLALLFGAVAQLLVFRYYIGWTGQPVADHFMFAWQVIPFGAAAVVAYGWSRIGRMREVPRLVVIAGLLQLLSLPILLPRAFQKPVELPGGGFSFEPNLVFLFAPFCQCVILGLCLLICVPWVLMKNWRENKSKAT